MSPRRTIPQQKKGLSPLVFVMGGIVVVLVIVGADLLSKALPTTSSFSANSRTAGDPKSTISFTEFSDFQ
ncbi:MAG: hypothetical protein HZB51_09300 [Chloroflexi bacterium]|nr:hypothetical protein [Chloroflexota bacterium]